MNVVNWFEIPVTDMDRAKAFYGEVFGRELTDLPSGDGGSMAAFPWEPGAANAAGALVQQADRQPGSKGTLVYFQCDDVSVEQGRVEAAGGTVVMPKLSIGDWGYIALVNDSEGNLIGLHSQQ